MTHFLVFVVAVGGLLELFSTIASLWIDWKTYQLRKQALSAVKKRD